MHSLKYNIATLSIGLCGLPLISNAQKAKESRPNIIIILADDIGWTDVGCNGAKKIKTPNIDALASDGINFTNGYAPASTSTPSRYALLTGNYAFRKNVSILPGDAPMTISNVNLASFLKENGYHTAVVGKWHLGLGDNNLDWNKKISPSPKDIGFDYSFIIPATGDRVPCVFLENGYVANHDVEKGDAPIEVSYRQKVGNDPDGINHPEQQKLKWLARNHSATIINGIPRIGWMSGGYRARWVDEDTPALLTQKAENFIEESAQTDAPFFLYFATHDAHEPRVASATYLGSSKCGIYGDVIQQFDASLGRIVKKLKELGEYENTIILFSSDNGPNIKEGYEDGALENMNGHSPFADLRGSKYSIYEGGVRVPYVFSWPKKIKKHRIDHRPISFANTFTTVASLIVAKLPQGIKLDAQNDANIYLKVKKRKENDVYMESSRALAIRSGDWKFIKYHNQQKELYNLADDISESKNIILNFPDVAKDLEEQMEQFKNR